MDYSYKPVMVLNYMQFKNMMLKERNNLREFFQSMWLDGGHPENSVPQIRFSNIFGDEFKFSIYGNDFQAWTITDITLIHKTLSLMDESLLAKQVREILDRSEDWTRGNVHCSDCGALTPYHEVMHNRFWAGIYCNPCWTREYKAREAKETYN